MITIKEVLLLQENLFFAGFLFQASIEIISQKR